MGAMQRGWIAILCLSLAWPAATQQRYQLAPLGFALDATDPGELPRPSRQQWRIALSAKFPPPPGADHRSLQREMLVAGHGRRRDVGGAFDAHGLSEAPAGRWRWPDLEWKPPGDGDQYLFVVPVSAAVPMPAIERLTAQALNGGPCGSLPVVRLGRLLPARQGMATFAVECRGRPPTPGGGIAQTDGVAAVAMVADGLALSYAAHGPGAGARHIDRFAALLATMRPEAIGGRQALRGDDHPFVRRLDAALQSLSRPFFASIEPARWEHAGPMNTRLCHAKWGEIPRTITCLRIFPAGERAESLLARLLLVDAWECGVRILQRTQGTDQASATLRCEDGGKVGGLATRIYIIRRSPVDGTLAFTAIYGNAEPDHLAAIARMADTALSEVLAQR